MTEAYAYTFKWIERKVLNFVSSFLQMLAKHTSCPFPECIAYVATCYCMKYWKSSCFRLFYGLTDCIAAVIFPKAAQYLQIGE